MTKFEFYTQNPERLADLLEQVTDDALEAEGCSLNLKLPEKLSDGQGEYTVTWESLLREEY